jgi:hypothetical protein
MCNESLSVKQDFLLASDLKSLSFIKYQLVYQVRDDNRYLKSFNILTREGTLIKKIYLKELLLLDESTDFEHIITEHLFSSHQEFHNQDRSKRKTSRKKAEVDPAARVDAINYLRSSLGI